MPTTDDSIDTVAGPYVILMVGVNGVGKTTSIGKLAHHFTESGRRVVLGAGDTFSGRRRRAIGNPGPAGRSGRYPPRCGRRPRRRGLRCIPGQQGPGKRDVLILDTAGRLHTKSNLMEELRKIHRVLKRQDSSAPHEVILTLDATTGHNGLAQAKSFQETVDCTGIFLAKLDGTAKGGIVLAIKKELQVPIMFIGTGESMADMAPFDANDFVDALLEPVP